MMDQFSPEVRELLERGRKLERRQRWSWLSRVIYSIATVFGGILGITVVALCAAIFARLVVCFYELIGG